MDKNVTPIKTLEGLTYDKPECYEPEKDNPYPLCVGKEKKECDRCCLYRDYNYDES